MGTLATSSHLPALAEPHARQTVAHELPLVERDAVSQDVLIDVVRTLEQQQRMLRAQLSGRP